LDKIEDPWGEKKRQKRWKLRRGGGEKSWGFFLTNSKMKSAKKKPMRKKRRECGKVLVKKALGGFSNAGCHFAGGGS